VLKATKPHNLLHFAVFETPILSPMPVSLLRAAGEAPGHAERYWSKMSYPLWQMFKTEWYLGFTTFGGPNVHFQIFNKMFVERLNWIDDQLYKEMFALCQALPGPGSTKMIYAINVLKFGFVIGVISFFMWR
jgi:hypothetical protein